MIDLRYRELCVACDDELAREVRDKLLFPWFEHQGYTDTCKDIDSWIVPAWDSEDIEAEIAELNMVHGVNLRAVWSNGRHP